MLKRFANDVLGAAKGLKKTPAKHTHSTTAYKWGQDDQILTGCTQLFLRFKTLGKLNKNHTLKASLQPRIFIWHTGTKWNFLQTPSPPPPPHTHYYPWDKIVSAWKAKKKEKKRESGTDTCQALPWVSSIPPPEQWRWLLHALTLLDGCRSHQTLVYHLSAPCKANKYHARRREKSDRNQTLVYPLSAPCKANKYHVRRRGKSDRSSIPFVSSLQSKPISCP